MLAAFLVVIVSTTLLCSIVLYTRLSDFVNFSVENKITAGAKTAAHLIDLSNMQGLLETSKQDPEYQNMLKTLYQFAQDNEFAYTYAVLKDAKGFRFVIDSGDFIEDDGDEDTKGTYYDDIPPAFQTALDSGSVTLTEPYTDEWGTFRSAVMPIQNKGKTVGAIAVDYEFSKLQARKQSAGWYALLASTVSLFVGLGIASIVSQRLVKSLKRTTTMLKNIASGDGDLTARLEVTGSDEVAELSTSFNTFVEKIQRIISEISEIVKMMNSATEELSTVSTSIAASAEEVSGQSSSVAAAVEQSSTNMNSISASSEEMSSSMNVVAAAVEELSASIKEIESSCIKESKAAESAFSKANDSTVTLENLRGASNEIGKIVDVIGQIADQTNLLALNATIEAASAGDAGKGFAVVASEVKELARQTVQATGNIKKQIESMQNRTQGAIETITGINSIIEEFHSISQANVVAVEQQNGAVSEIARNVANVNTEANTVSRSVGESSGALQEIAHTVNGLNEAVGESTRGVQQIDDNLTDLVKTSESLRKIVGQFKI